MIIDAFIVVLCGIGFFISLYFTLVYYEKISPNQFLVPHWCRMNNTTCLYVIHTPQARLFGVPNSLLGMLYYQSIMLIGVHCYEQFPGIVILMFTAIPALSSLYLLYSLRKTLKTHCILCYICNTINIILVLIIPVTRS